MTSWAPEPLVDEEPDKAPFAPTLVVERADPLVAARPMAHGQPPSGIAARPRTLLTLAVQRVIPRSDNSLKRDRLSLGRCSILNT